MQREAAGAIPQRFEHGAAQRQPLIRRVRAKAAGDRPEGVGRLLFVGKGPCFSQILADALQCLPLKRWPNVVEHQPAHLGERRGLGQASHHHADEAAHAGAKPVERGGLELLQQGQHVGSVVRNLVALGVLEPVALAAPDHIGTDHAQAVTGAGGMGAQGLGQHIKIAALTGQSMHTHHHMAAVGLAPLPVGHAVAALGVGAGDKFEGGLWHGEMGNQKGDGIMGGWHVPMASVRHMA